MHYASCAQSGLRIKSWKSKPSLSFVFCLGFGLLGELAWPGIHPFTSIPKMLTSQQLSRQPPSPFKVPQCFKASEGLHDLANAIALLFYGTSSMFSPERLNQLGTREVNIHSSEKPRPCWIRWHCIPDIWNGILPRSSGVRSSQICKWHSNNIGPSHSNSQKKDYTITIALFTQSLVTWPVEMLNTWVIQQTLQPHKNNDTTK